MYQIQYNLQLLKAMLEEVYTHRPTLSHSESPTEQKSGGSGVVDLETYSHVIRLWVKDVRDRSNQQPPLELSQLSSDSEVRVQIPCSLSIHWECRKVMMVLLRDLSCRLVSV